MNQQWIIVFPQGRKGEIDLALAWDYEFHEYQRASRHSWLYDDKESAIEYGRSLIDKHLHIRGVGELAAEDFLD